MSDCQQEMSYYVNQVRKQNTKNRFYVYLHKKKSTGEIFYVGKGCGTRAWNTYNRNKYWTNTFKKHGFTVDILFNNLDEETSLLVEKDTILELNYFGCNLCNLTEGGESPRFNEESRKKMSLARSGKPKSESHKRAMSLAQMGRKRLDLAGSNNPNFDKTIYLFEHISGLNFFGTRSDLCNEHNLNPNLLKALFLTNNKRKSSQGWKLKEQNDRKN